MSDNTMVNENDDAKVIELTRACEAWLDAKIEAERASRVLSEQESDLRQTVKRVSAASPLVIAKDGVTYLLTYDSHGYGYVPVFTPEQAIKEGIPF